MAGWMGPRVGKNAVKRKISLPIIKFCSLDDAAHSLVAMLTAIATPHLEYTLVAQLTDWCGGSSFASLTLRFKNNTCIGNSAFLLL
jgi:hypothetical protein